LFNERKGKGEKNRERKKRGKDTVIERKRGREEERERREIRALLLTFYWSEVFPPEKAP
jgi:hypothetical protein